MVCEWTKEGDEGRGKIEDEGREEIRRGGNTQDSSVAGMFHLLGWEVDTRVVVCLFVR